MPPTKLHPVHLGEVRAKDPTLLVPGECVKISDGYYKPSDGGIWTHRGRVKLNTVSSDDAVIGLRYIEFDGTDPDYVGVLTLGAKNYRFAPPQGGNPTILSGTPDQIQQLTGTASKMWSVHYNNQWILMNGVDNNLVLTGVSGRNGYTNFKGTTDGSLQKMGLPIGASPPAWTDETGSTYTLSLAATMTYWVEERVKDDDGVIIKRRGVTNGIGLAQDVADGVLASAPGGSDGLLELTGDGSAQSYGFTVAQDSLDVESTHLALFATATNGAFPAGAEIAEIEIDADPANNLLLETRTGTDPLIPGGTIYQVVTVQLGTTTQSLPRAGDPPVSSTGDVWQGAILLNDVNSPRDVVFNYPDEIHEWPANYRITMETGEHDEVLVIRRVGSVPIILMRDSLWRANYLPSDQDALFQTNAVVEQILGAFGVAGEYGAARFSYGQGDRLAYIAREGLQVTDGRQWDSLEDDLNWEDEVNVDALGGAVLQNNPTLYRLEAHVPSKGSLYNDKILYFYYHPSHAKFSKQGAFRAKVTRSPRGGARSSVLVLSSNERRIYTGWPEGDYYHEHVGEVDERGDAISLDVLSGEDRIGGAGKEAEMDALAAHHSAAAGAVGKVVLVERNRGEPDIRTDSEIKLDRRELTYGDQEGQAETFQYGFKVDDQKEEVRLDYFEIESGSLGDTTNPS